MSAKTSAVHSTSLSKSFKPIQTAQTLPFSTFRHTSYTHRVLTVSSGSLHKKSIMTFYSHSNSNIETDKDNKEYLNGRRAATSLRDIDPTMSSLGTNEFPFSPISVHKIDDKNPNKDIEYEELPQLKLPDFVTSKYESFMPSNISLNSKNIDKIPIELVLHIFEKLDTSDLTTVRCTASKFNALASNILYDRASKKTDEIDEKLKKSKSSYDEILETTGPSLEHYRGYLRDINLKYIQDLSFMETVPPEVESVCECLCLLSNIDHSLRTENAFSHDDFVKSLHTIMDNEQKSQSDFKSISMVNSRRNSEVGESSYNMKSISNSTSLSSIKSYDNYEFETFQGDNEEWMLPNSTVSPKFYSWDIIRRWMKRPEFKSWINNLRVEVECIPIKAVSKVEKLLMLDVNITYDRLRSISLPGYRLLIIVAACLQFCIRYNKVTIARSDVIDNERSLTYINKYMDCLLSSKEIGKPNLETTDRKL